MTNQNRVPAGSPEGGQYAPGAHDETELHLGLGSDAAEQIEDSEMLREYLDSRVESYGPAIRESDKAVLEEMPNNSTRELFVAFAQNRMHYGGLDASRATDLNRLGYTKDDISTIQKYDAWTLSRENIPAPMARAFADRKISSSVLGVSYVTDALRDTEHADAVEAAIRDTASTRMSDIVRASDPSRADRLERGTALGLKPQEITEELDLEQHAGVAQGLADSKRYLASDMVRRGHDAASLKKFGSGPCEFFSRDTLEDSGLKPTTIRSLHAKGVTNISDMKTLSEAGLSKGSDYAKLRKISDNSDGVNTHVQVYERSGRNIPALEKYSHVLHGKITPSDAAHIKNLVERGYEDPDSLRALSSAGFSAEASRHVPASDQDVLQTYDDLTRANVSPERIGVMSRAGVPPQDMAQYANDPNVWKSAKHYRDRYNEREEQQAKFTGRPPRRWPFDSKGREIKSTNAA